MNKKGDVYAVPSSLCKSACYADNQHNSEYEV